MDPVLEPDGLEYARFVVNLYRLDMLSFSYRPRCVIDASLL